MSSIPRPGSDEYAPAFASYVVRVAEQEDILTALAGQLDEVQRRLASVPEARGDYRYGAGKWSIKEVVGHLSDTERVFSYRALRVGRGDPTPLPSVDDKAYAPEMGAADRTLGEMVAEWVAVRRATLTLFRGLPERAWQRRGVASGQPISVRALAYIIVGHARHHLEVLEARYAVEAHGAGDRARPSVP